MRVILAKVLFHFDMHLQTESKDWLSQNKLYTLWEKPALMVELKPVGK